MPTTISSTLNDEIISQKALEAFTAELAPLNAFSTDFSSEFAGKGTAIQVPLLSSLSATTTENDYETDSGSAGYVTVPLDKYQKSTVGLTDKQFASSSAATLELFAAQQAKAVARAVLLDVLSLVLNANFAAKTTKALASFTSADVRAIRVALSKADIPKSDRTLFLDPDYYDKLVGDTSISIASALHYGGTDVIREGNIPRFLGFGITESTIIPDNSENLKGFACHPSALAIAMRVLQPQEPSEYLETRTVTDKKTGITLGYRRHYSPAKGKHFVTFEAVYGRVVADGTALHRIVSA